MACALLGTLKEIPHLSPNSSADDSQCGRKRGGLVIAGPGWTGRLAKARDTELDPRRSSDEGSLRPGVKLSHWDLRDGDPQTFAT